MCQCVHGLKEGRQNGDPCEVKNILALVFEGMNTCVMHGALGSRRTRRNMDDKKI